MFCSLYFFPYHFFGRFWPFSEAKVKFCGSKILVKDENNFFPFTLTNFFKCPSSSHNKILLLYQTQFPEHLSLYRICKKQELRFGHFSMFFQLRTVFGPFLGTVVKKAKYKKVAPGISLNSREKIEILASIYNRDSNTTTEKNKSLLQSSSSFCASNCPSQQIHYKTSIGHFFCKKINIVK